MKRIFFFSIYISMLISSLFIFVPQTKAAWVGAQTNATFYFSPNSATYNKDDTFTLAININTGGNNVIVAEAIVNWDTAVFQLTATNTDNSVFNSGNACTYSGKPCEIIDVSTPGKVDITKAKPSPGVNTSSGNFATLTFKALATTSPSTDNITFSFTSAGASGDSDIIQDTDDTPDILTGVNNAKIIIQQVSQASPTSPSTPTGTGSGTSGSTGTSGAIPTSKTYANDTLLKSSTSPDIYVIKDNKLQLIPNWRSFVSFGYQLNKIQTISQEEINKIELTDSNKIDSDNDKLTNAQERQYGTDAAKADTDGDGYNDYEEISIGYDPLVPAGAKPLPIFAYGKSRLRSLADEQERARILRSELEKKYTKEQLKGLSAKNWVTVVNSYIYGGYPVEAIVKALKYAGKTVHPTIPWSAWSKSGDYLSYINR